MPGVTLAFVVDVVADEGLPQGQTVMFSVSPDDGTVSLSPMSAITNEYGLAQTTLTIGSDASGSYTVTATLNDGISVSETMTVEAAPLPPPPLRTLVMFSDNLGFVQPGDSVTFTAEVGEGGSPVQGQTVTFSVNPDNGTASSSPTSMVTGSNGQTQTTLTLGNSASGSYTVTASVGISAVNAIVEVVEPETSAPQQQQSSSPTPMPTALAVILDDDPSGLTGEGLPNPLVVEVRDQYGDPVGGVPVTFAVSAGDGMLSDTTVTTNVYGQAESTLILGTDPGTNTVEASVEGISQMVIFNAEVSLPLPMPTALSIISGDNQSGLTGETLMNPFVVEVRDQNGNPMEGVTVTFAVSAGGGSLSDMSVDTDANGLAQSTLTLGSDPGTNTVTASVEGISQMAIFSAEASLPPPEPTVLSIISGENQEGLTGEPLMTPFIVEVHDQYDDPMESVTVTFAVIAGGGSLNATTGTTNANGQAESTLILGSDPGTNTVEVSVEGITETATFNAEASLPPPMATSLKVILGDNQTGLTSETLMNPFVVEVHDQYDTLMEGVTVTFAVSGGGGMLSATAAMTDANGQAESTLILGSDPGTNTVEVSVEDIAETATFNAEASLPPPMATSLKVISGDNQTGLTGEALVNPFVVEVRDQYDAPMEGITVTFVVSAGGGRLSATAAMTDANGQAESTLTLGSDPGTNTVGVSVEGITETATFNAEASLPPPMATSLKVISGDNQTGLTSETLMNPFVVEVHDQYDDPMESVTVTFAVIAGGGSLNATTGTTNANGQAESTLILGSDPGTNTVEVSVGDLSQTFNAEAALPPPMPTILSIVLGDNQTGLTSETLMTPFVVEVRDQYDTPMEGVTVTFAVSGGGGMLSDISVDTDANGLAQSTLTLGSDPGGYTVTVSVEGIAETATFNAIAELLEFDLSLPSGISLIHVPLKVRAIDGVAGAIESVADLYDALGGASTVNFLITYDSQAQEWRSYLRGVHK